MKKYLSIILLLTIGSFATQAQSFAEKITSSPWSGSGMLMGAEASFEMKWEKVLNGQFLKLTFQNKRTANGQEIVFDAIGFYKITGDKVQGTWFDARGISFPLSGTIEEDLLSITWGSEDTEQGKTEYRFLSAESVQVKDFILQNGKYAQFGEAVYKSK